MSFPDPSSNDAAPTSSEESIVGNGWVMVRQQDVFQNEAAEKGPEDIDFHNSYPPTYGYCTASSHCMGHNVECNLRISRCVCRRNYADNGTGICSECPFEGDPCSHCCSEIGVACINGVCRRCFTDDGRSLCK